MINKQRHSFACGIVSTVNALRWLGYNNTYKEVLEHTKKYITKNINGGLWPKEVRQLLKDYSIKYKTTNYPTFKFMEKEIDKGNAVLFLYKWKRSENIGGHYTFITHYTKHFWVAWNNANNNKTAYQNRKVLARDLRYSNLIRDKLFKMHGTVYPKAIIILGNQ